MIDRMLDALATNDVFMAWMYRGAIASEFLGLLILVGVASYVSTLCWRMWVPR